MKLNKKNDVVLDWLKKKFDQYKKQIDHTKPIGYSNYELKQMDILSNLIELRTGELK